MAPEIVVEFDAATHSLSALRAAAYRLIGTAACRIEQQAGRYLCYLTVRDDKRRHRTDEPDLRSQFLDLVTDENLREQLTAKTEPIRNVILSLAFGSLAAETADRS
jgi:His-Xaa-Ser system protein HxsD